MENGPFIDVLPIKMVILNSYVSLPEGTPFSDTPIARLMQPGHVDFGGEFPLAHRRLHLVSNLRG